MSLNNIRNEGESVYYFSFLYYFVIDSGEGNGNPLQDSCVGNPMDRGAWWGYGPWGHKRVGHDLATKQQQQQREQSEKQLVGEDYLFSMILRISCSGLYKNSDW